MNRIKEYFTDCSTKDHRPLLGFFAAGASIWFLIGYVLLT